MGIREDKVNELIEEISNMQKDLVDEQVSLIESYFVSGPASNGQGVFTVLDEYLTNMNKTIGSMSFNSRMNFGIDDTVYNINKILVELDGTDENPSLAKQCANKARPTISEKVEGQISHVISIIKEVNSNDIKIEKENKAITGITEEQRANRTRKQKAENLNKACKDIENSIRTVKINRRPFDNIVINNKAIKEATEPAKRYLYNLSKTAMHSMYKGIWIANEVEALNAQLSNQNYSIRINSMLNKADEDLIKNVCNKLKQAEAEIELKQTNQAKAQKKQIISKVLLNDKLKTAEVKS